MNRLRNLIACLSPALLLIAGSAPAETVIWSDNFDTNGASRWSASTAGVWQIGSPATGPSHAHSGADCASTQGYGYNREARLVCTNYDGASSLTVPTADQFPRLRFWHWFNFYNALGDVEISADGGNTWIQISPTYELNYDINSNGNWINSGGVWTRPYLNLTPYAGQNILIAFHFRSGVYGNGLGWFVDDVAVVTGNPVLNFPEGFEAGEGDWSVDYGTWEVGTPTSGPPRANSGTNCAGTVLAGNYALYADTRLISPPFLIPASGSPKLSFYHWYNLNNALGFVEINNGAATITINTNTSTSTNTSVVLNTNIYQFANSADPAYAAPFYWNPIIGDWTNSLGKAVGYTTTTGDYFESGYASIAIGGANVDYRAEILPNPPSAPTNFFQLQGMTWEPVANESDFPVGYFATNSSSAYTTNITFTTNQATWTQLSPTYENSASGGWTNVVLDLSTNAGQTVQIAFHFSSGGISGDIAPGWYVDDINLIGAPELIGPTNFTFYAGQPIALAFYATNTILPNDTYTFAQFSAPTNFVLTGMGTGSAVLTCTNNALLPGNYTISLKATDLSTPGLFATNSFELVILPTPPPTLIPPTNQTIYVGLTLTTMLSASNAYLPNAIYTFSLVSPTNAAIQVTSNGVLTWTPALTQPTGANTITLAVTENSQPPLSATNSFVVTVSNLWAPVLTTPSEQTIYAGQTLTVTCSATNYNIPYDTFTFALLGGLTNAQANLDTFDLASQGMLDWTTTTALLAGTYTNVIEVTDNLTQLTATNSFLIIVSNPPPPVLILPPTETVYAGRQLVAPISAANSAFPNITYTFTLNNPPSGVSLASPGATNAIVTWTPSAAQALKGYSISVTAADGNQPPLLATNSLLVFVDPPPPAPTLVFPQPTPTNHVGQTLAVTISATNTFATNSMFAYRLPAPSTNYWLATNGVLTWTNTGIRNGVLIWTNDSVAPGSTPITVIVSDDSVPPLSATNSFAWVTLPPLPPQLLLTNQTIYSGQTFTVTDYAINSILTNASYSFALLAPVTNAFLTSNGPASALLAWTNTGVVNGVLTWTNGPAVPGTYAVVLEATDNSQPPLSMTNSFNVVIQAPPPPQLFPPANQTIHVGQTLAVTNYASNSILPYASYIFSLPAPSSNVVLATSGVLTWTNLAAVPGTNVITVKVTDNSRPPLSATNSFIIVVIPKSPNLAGGLVSRNLAAGFKLSFQTSSNTTWQIQAATNPAAIGTNWLPIFTNFTGPNDVLIFTDLFATNFPQRYYRAVLP